MWINIEIMGQRIRGPIQCILYVDRAFWGFSYLNDSCKFIILIGHTPTRSRSKKTHIYIIHN